MLFSNLDFTLYLFKEKTFLKFEKISGTLLKFGNKPLMSFFQQVKSVTKASNMTTIGKYIGRMNNDNIASIFFQIITFYVKYKFKYLYILLEIVLIDSNNY